MRNPNFLILDEPTNDLDIVTLGLLEEYLTEFKGCVIVVSHDRYFLDNIADHLFALEGDGVVKDFPGTYSEYHEWRQEQLAAKREAEAEKTKEKPTNNKVRPDRPKKLSFKEQRELEALEKELESLNAEKDELDILFNSGEVINDVSAKAARYEELKELIDEKEMRWLELSE